MSQPPRQRLRVRIVNDVAVVYFEDHRIETEEDVLEIRSQLYTLVDGGNHTKLLLNFSNVEFVTSMMLGGLINLKKKVGLINGQLRFCCFDRDVWRRAFQIAGIDRVFWFVDNEKAALDTF